MLVQNNLQAKFEDKRTTTRKQTDQGCTREQCESYKTLLMSSSDCNSLNLVVLCGRQTSRGMKLRPAKDFACALKARLKHFIQGKEAVVLPHFAIFLQHEATQILWSIGKSNQGRILNALKIQIKGGRSTCRLSLHLQGLCYFQSHHSQFQ